MTPFDEFIGIDWSGARGRGYAGVAVARCAPGDDAPALVAPPRNAILTRTSARWTRAAVRDCLSTELQDGKRLLIGMDFAFALPHPPFAAAPELWGQIDAHCANFDDLWGGAYAESHSQFWHRGTRPPDWQEYKRATERACKAAGMGHPETPLKLIGAKQVGKGALAGMRLLHQLRQQHADRLAAWPFDGSDASRDPQKSVVVEIYPRLFIRRAGGGDTKLRDVAALNTALAALGSAPVGLDQFDDHEADALVTAAGLRMSATEPALWQAGIGQLEGWIFGVPGPL